MHSYLFNFISHSIRKHPIQLIQTKVESGMHTIEVKDTNDMMRENNHRINGSASSEDYDNLCHEKFEEYGYLVTDLGNFWLEGILLLVVGVFGVAGNIMTIVVLRKMETNTTFNRLLMSLGKKIKLYF